MMMVLDFRIWIGLCFEQNFWIRIGFGYYWNFSERIRLSNFNIHTTLVCVWRQAFWVCNFKETFKRLFSLDSVYFAARMAAAKGLVEKRM